MLVDEVAAAGEEGPRGRNAARTMIDDFMERPFDPKKAAQFDRDLWARKNVEAATAAGMGTPEDPFLVGPSEEELERMVAAGEIDP